MFWRQKQTSQRPGATRKQAVARSHMLIQYKVVQKIARKIVLCRNYFFRLIYFIPGIVRQILRSLVFSTRRTFPLLLGVPFSRASLRVGVDHMGCSTEKTFSFKKRRKERDLYGCDATRENQHRAKKNMLAGAPHAKHRRNGLTDSPLKEYGRSSRRRGGQGRWEGRREGGRGGGKETTRRQLFVATAQPCQTLGMTLLNFWVASFCFMIFSRE